MWASTSSAATYSSVSAHQPMSVPKHGLCSTPAAQLHEERHMNPVSGQPPQVAQAGEPHSCPAQSISAGPGKAANRSLFPAGW